MPTARRIARGAFFALTLSAGAAVADEDTVRARDAYDRGVRAHATSDFAAAAKAFAEADALAPTPASLEAALEDAMKADDVVLGAELLDRAARRNEHDAGLTRTVEAAKKRFAGRYGTIRVECTGTEKCLVALDGRAVGDSARLFYAASGPHTILVQRGETRLERLVEVRSGEAVRVSMVPKANSTTLATQVHREPKTSDNGLSPTWFYVAAGVTAVAMGATIWSGVDAVSKHDAFAECAPGASGPKPNDCTSRSDDGKSATLRTNVLVGATVVLAGVTAAMGIFFVRWSGTTVAVGGHFR